MPGPASLAHILRPGEVVPPPGEQLDQAAVVRYAAAVTASAAAIDATRMTVAARPALDTVTAPPRPPATFEWLRGNTARIRARVSPGDLLSVQIAWFPGWKATAAGRDIPITRDGLGFLLLHPDLPGDSEILLRWTGRSDYLPAAVVSTLALLLVAFCMARDTMWQWPRRPR